MWLFIDKKCDYLLSIFCAVILLISLLISKTRFPPTLFKKKHQINQKTSLSSFWDFWIREKDVFEISFEISFKPAPRRYNINPIHRQHGIKIRMIFCLSFVFIGQFNHYIISSYSLFFHRSIHLLFNAKLFASNRNYSKKLKYFCPF